MTIAFGADAATSQGDWKVEPSFGQVEQHANDLAKRPFVPGASDLPESLRRLDYDRYRLIAFRQEESIWRNSGLPFELECFHRGYLYGDRVMLNLVEDGRVRRLPFHQELFEYRGELSDLSLAQDIGFAGFRVVGGFEASPERLEIASFLGSSYFRAIGKGQVYGTSARGLGVDIGLPKDEEFPLFREFWIQRPETGSRELRIDALLDSPSVAGAYQFVLKPGKATIWNVSARLFFRRQPEKIGLSPLTSMWQWGDGRAAPEGDPRPEVHDADGLLVRSDGDEWIWRPLSRHDYPSLSRYEFTGIRGFGLLQRDRRYQSYRDDEAKYHLRPSVWIQPHGGWGPGAVELLEYPAAHEGFDNIAAWWTPLEPVSTEQPLKLDYTVSFSSTEPEVHALARAVATAVDRGEGRPIRLEIEFRGQTLVTAVDQKIVADVRCQRGQVDLIRWTRQRDDICQLSFQLHPENAAPVELSAVLYDTAKPLTETWRYLCPTSRE